MSVIEVFGPVADALADLAPEKVAMLKAPPQMAARVEALLQKKADEALPEEEAIELERYLSLDLLISLAKARAAAILAS